MTAQKTIPATGAIRRGFATSATMRWGRRLAAAGTAVLVLAGAGYLVYGALNDFLGPIRGGDSVEAASPVGTEIESERQARILLRDEQRNLGPMRVDEERSVDFQLRNVGDRALEIAQVRTSCMCTFAQVIVDGKASPLFTFEESNSAAERQWRAFVRPGHSATIRLIYRPALMPVLGPVARNVTFTTNDPNRRFVALGIRATVQ